MYIHVCIYIYICVYTYVFSYCKYIGKQNTKANKTTCEVAHLCRCPEGLAFCGLVNTTKAARIVGGRLPNPYHFVKEYQLCQIS